MGSTALRVCQFGKESVWGTGVAATALMSGLNDLRFKPQVTNLQRRWLTGNFTPASAVVQTDRRGSASLNGDFTFEDFIYILLSSVKGGVTPTGAGDAKTWTFPFATTAAPNIESRTLEFSDGSQEYELEGGICASWQLAGGGGDDALITFNSNWIGKNLLPSTLTAALTQREFEVLAAAKMALKLDDFGGTIGTTAKAATLISWTLDYNLGVHLKKFQDASINPAAFGYGIPDATLGLSLEFNAIGKAEVDKYLANTGRLVQLVGQGSLISGADYKKLTVDFAGDITDVSDMWGDRDGNTTVDLTLKPRYDAGAFANWGKIEIVNEVATAVG